MVFACCILDKNEILVDGKKVSNSSERIIIGGENDGGLITSYNNHVSNELLQKFEGKSREVCKIIL